MTKHRLTPRHQSRYDPRRRAARPSDRSGRTLLLAILLTATIIAVPILAVHEFQTGHLGGDAAAETSLRTTPTPSASGSSGQPPTTPSKNSNREPSRSVLTPTPRPVPEAGTGTFTVTSAAPNETSGAITYTVEVEHGLPFRPAEVARFVDETLSDRRGWSSDGNRPLAHVDANADLRVILASPETADNLCAPLDTDGRLSCRNGGNVVINAWRWRHGADSYVGDIGGYRRYVVNHETGHALGHPHASCPGPNKLAPVMLQQTLGLDGCRANPWPESVDLRTSSLH